MNLLTRGSALAAFFAGMVALFAPCCIVFPRMRSARTWPPTGVRTPFLIDTGATMSAAYGTLGKGMHPGLPGRGFVLIDASGTQRWYGESPSMYLSSADLLKQIRRSPALVRGAFWGALDRTEEGGDMTARTWKPGEPGSGRFVAASGIGLDLAEFLVGAATWAPSLHNTQPWRFVHRADGSIELWADQRRALRATDPAGREMVISCGAALATLALGVRWLGHQPEVRRCPDPGRPMLLARIAAGPARAPSPLELDQFAAVLDRHTHRGPFDNVPVAPALLVCLRRLARRVGCRAQLIDDSRLRRVVELTLAAQQTQCGQPSVRAEQNDWLRLRVSPEQDGVILAVPGGISTGVARLAPRWLGAPATPPAISPETGANHPPTILLSTSDDDTVAWLRTGEALQHILLYAATHGVYASIHTQPVEVPSTRAELARISSDAHPQMLFQLGHATSVSESHRRAVAQVLVARR